MDIGFIYAIGASILWGLTYALDQRILNVISPSVLLFINAVATVVIMLPFILVKNISVKNELVKSDGATLGLVIVTIILGTIASFFIYSGIKNLDASTASIIEISYPFFVVLFSYIMFRSVPNIFFFLGAVLVFIGSFIIIRFA